MTKKRFSCSLIICWRQNSEDVSVTAVVATLFTIEGEHLVSK